MHFQNYLCPCKLASLYRVVFFVQNEARNIQIVQLGLFEDLKHPRLTCQPATRPEGF